jgi:PAS domain-containing protein
MEEVKLRLQLALEAAGMTIWDASVEAGSVADGTVYWSAEGAALLGLPPNEQEQPFRQFLSLVHPDDRQAMFDLMQRRVDQCGSYEVEYRVVRPDGTPRRLAARASTLCEDGLPVRTLGVIWDVSEFPQPALQLSAR